MVSEFHGKFLQALNLNLKLKKKKKFFSVNRKTISLHIEDCHRKTVYKQKFLMSTTIPLALLGEGLKIFCFFISLVLMSHK